jgi:eukaryotic-like serine/threonine-protein kinase
VSATAFTSTPPVARSGAFVIPLEELGELAPVGRPGGQGRVYQPARVPPRLAGGPVVIKLYRRAPSTAAVDLLAAMIAWSLELDAGQRAQLHEVTAWPVAIVTRGGSPAGIVMRDVRDRFEVPFVMPSGRKQRVLVSLEHLLGGDDYLQLRGLGVRLDTTTRAAVAERVAGALAFLHRHGVVASDIAPNNLLVRFGVGHGAQVRPAPEVCLIDCDSMVFHGRQALASVETADWQIPAEYSEPPRTRAADAYKLGLVILRLFARSHDARSLAPHVAHVPAELRGLVTRSLSADATNRPPAGEWQRALRHVLTQGRLNERYPGPAPVRATAARATIPRRREMPAATRAPRGLSQPSQPAPPQRRTRGPLSLAWIVIAVVVFALILARLVAAVAPSFGGGGGFAPSGNDQPNSSAPYYYYAPPGTGQGSGLR